MKTWKGCKYWVVSPISLQSSGKFCVKYNDSYHISYVYKLCFLQKGKTRQAWHPDLYVFNQPMLPESLWKGFFLMPGLFPWRQEAAALHGMKTTPFSLTTYNTAFYLHNQWTLGIMWYIYLKKSILIFWKEKLKKKSTNHMNWLQFHSYTTYSARGKN